MSGGFKNRQEYPDELSPEEFLWVQSGAAGILLLEEQASSPTATAGFGKVYVKTDKKLYYLDEDGVEVELGAGGGSSTPETPTGTVNSVNATFTPSSEPKWVVADGTTYFDGAGYTWGGTDITMEVPPSQYIRVII